MKFEKFKEIRKLYKRVLPFWMADYEQTGRMHHDPYIMDWVPTFTPIEWDVWSDIRGYGIPFYPQMPVLNYFIDFGCPFLKIGIECDGKAWHDHDLDKARDERLYREGWMIFRIEGHKCRRIIEPFEIEDDEEREAAFHDFYMMTSTGIISAIKKVYFEDAPIEKHYDLIHNTLFEHRSTPETYPIRRQVVIDKRGPVLLADMLEEYIELLRLRQKSAAA